MENLKEKFNILNIEKTVDGLEKVTLDKRDLKKCLSTLKNSAEYSYDVLLSINAIDFIEKIELIYTIYSSKLNHIKLISAFVDSDNPVIESISSVFKSANFDEREIFDLFGVSFEGHKNIKRILMPNSSVGHPLLKNYSKNDERFYD